MSLKFDVPNPIHCAVCVNIGDMRQRAETIIRGTAVCIPHALFLDGYETLTAALDAWRAGRHQMCPVRRSVGGSGGGTGTV